MNLIEFPEQTVVIAKDHPEYQPLPAHQVPNSQQGEIICCWRLTWRERFRLLFTGKVWHSIWTFNQPLQPQLLSSDKPQMATPTEVKAAEDSAQMARRNVVKEWEDAMIRKYGVEADEKKRQLDRSGVPMSDLRRIFVFERKDFEAARRLGVKFFFGLRIKY